MGFSGKKLLLLGFIVVLMVVIPLTVYLVQQQQKLKVGAQQASSLSFVSPDSSSTINTPAGIAKFDIMLDPSTNQVSFVKLVINFDTAKLRVTTFTPDTTNFPSTLQTADLGTTTGKATITLSVGQESTKIITGSPPKRVATISFNALSTATAGTTQILFDRDPTAGTQVLSVGTGDQFNENVLANAPPTTITIAQTAVGGTPATQTSTASCTSLNSDKGTTGTAPFPVTLTAIGSATGTSTISKVTFNWGDGPVQDFTTGGGIGTNSVNFPNPHTYNNAGTFVATATFTDNAGAVSAVGACTKTFTLAAASSPTPTPTPAPASGTGGTGATGGTGTTQIVTVATPTPTVTPVITPAPGTKGGLPAPGPGDKIVSFGGFGILSVIIGALLLFGL